MGDALDPETKMGPAVSESQLRPNLSYVDIAVKEGGHLLRGGGERLSLAKPGYYMSPAIIADTTSAMRINREEVFGPVASVIRVRDYDEALAVANAGEFKFVQVAASARARSNMRGISSVRRALAW